MNDEMTNEQIDNGLAKWHSEHDALDEWRIIDTYLYKIIGGAPCRNFKPYTESLDTMRLIEVLMTDDQRHSCYVFCGLEYGEPYMATAEQRARAAFTVLGLKIEEDCAITVSARDFETLVERIEKPAPPSTFLKEMMTKYPRKTKPPAAILGETNE